MLNYFNDNNLVFSMESARNFLFSNKISRMQRSLCASALNKIENIYNNEEIKGRTLSKISKNFNLLSENFKEILRLIITRMDVYSTFTKEKKVKFLSDILLRLQDNGFYNINEVTYGTIIDLIMSYDDEKTSKKYNINENISYFLNSLHEMNIVKFGFTLLPNALKSIYKDFFIKSYNTENEGLFDGINNNSGCIDINNFLNTKYEIIEEYKKNKYSLSRINKISLILTHIYLFLDINSLNYSPKVGNFWLDLVKEKLDKNSFFNNQRVISILNKRIKDVNIELSDYYRFAKKNSDFLPDWCKKDVLSFLDIKSKESLSKKTIENYLLCIYKFCKFLDESEVKSFENLTVETIKNFNLTDKHDSPYGKNAYNSRIRKFLEYLCLNQKTKNELLYLALPSVRTKRESLITILTKDQEKKLEEIFLAKNDKYSLRAIAITQLGLYMGLRSIDIVNITIDDIDWENLKIRIFQKKTKHEIFLPMPTIVANSIYES